MDFHSRSIWELKSLSSSSSAGFSYLVEGFNQISVILAGFRTFAITLPIASFADQRLTFLMLLQVIVFGSD